MRSLIKANLPKISYGNIRNIIFGVDFMNYSTNLLDKLKNKTTSIDKWSGQHNHNVVRL
jgi:hypothetical protein